MPRPRSRCRAICCSAREASHDIVGLFNHRKLILAHGNERRAKRGDVRGLTHRLRDEASGDVAGKPTALDLAAHGRISLEPLERDETEIQQSELPEFGNRVPIRNTPEKRQPQRQ
jgi:hypothetical protein